MSIAVTKEIAPSVWASYLINGDASGLDDDDIAACYAWCEAMEPAYVVSTVDEDPWFTWSYALYGGTASGGNVFTYVLHRQKRKYTRKHLT